MDIKTIQNMILLMPRHKLPETVTTRTERVPLTKKFEGSSAQPAPMIPIHSYASLRVLLGASSEQPTMPADPAPIKPAAAPPPSPKNRPLPMSPCFPPWYNLCVTFAFQKLVKYEHKLLST
ncbi:hypothetical protein PtB15_13B162 [Puccinia triticina]|nr:hypothetical protein PtB15_13B162 [Puccinia triticina]